MPEESYSFAKTRVRLEEIVTQVRKKDTSLEKSLDLLEEGVRLANQCTELIDRADWEAAGAADSGVAESATGGDAGTDGPAQALAAGGGGAQPDEESARAAAALSGDDDEREDVTPTS